MRGPRGQGAGTLIRRRIDEFAFRFPCKTTNCQLTNIAQPRFRNVTTHHSQLTTHHSRLTTHDSRTPTHASRNYHHPPRRTHHPPLTTNHQPEHMKTLKQLNPLTNPARKLRHSLPQLSTANCQHCQLTFRNCQLRNSKIAHIALTRLFKTVLNYFFPPLRSISVTTFATKS